MPSTSPDALGFSCACGSLSGHIDAAAAKQGTRIVCHCADCRAVELYHGAPDPKDSGVDLLQLNPDMVKIAQGAEHLQLLQLSPRGYTVGTLGVAARLCLTACANPGCLSSLYAVRFCRA